VTALLGQGFTLYSKSKIGKRDATLPEDYCCPLITWGTELLCTRYTMLHLLVKSMFRYLWIPQVCSPVSVVGEGCQFPVLLLPRSHRDRMLKEISVPQMTYT